MADKVQGLPPPSGDWVQASTTVGAYNLTKDGQPYHPYDINDANLPDNTWDVNLKAFDNVYVGLSGTDSLAWIIDCSDSNIKLSLIDYGTDSGRTNIVKTIDLKTTNSYNIDVSGIMGPYRYLDLVLDKTTTCIENWNCTGWSKCAKQKQTRACIDLNNCGTSLNKPATNQSCCIENWKCTPWSKCVDGKRARNCTDSNGCGTAADKPVETKSCGNTGSSDIIELNSRQETTQKSFLEGIVNFFMSLF